MLITKEAQELSPGQDVYRDGWRYTVSNITREGEVLIVDVVNPRAATTADLGFPAESQYRWHERRPIAVFTP